MRAAELPQGGLQARTQALEALGEAHRPPLPVRVRQHKVIEQVIEWLALDPYPEAIHVREVRLTKLAWLVPLLEKHFFRWTLERTPLLHPPLQRSKLPVLKLARVTTLEILEQRLRLKAWVQLQLRANLLPHLFERILTRAPVSFLVHFTRQLPQTTVLSRRLLIHPGLRRRQRQRLLLVQQLHQLPHLTVCYQSNLLSL